MSAYQGTSDYMLFIRLIIFVLELFYLYKIFVLELLYNIYMHVCVYICTFSIIMLYKYSHLAYLSPGNLVLKSQFSIVQYHLLKSGTIAWVP